MNLTGRAPYVKGQPVKPSRPSGKDPAYLTRVRELPCCICAEWGLPQLSPTQSHHPIHGRHGNRKVPDRMAIPLCEGHHQGMFDTSKLALHREPAEWKRLYGRDVGGISWTEERLAEQDARTVGAGNRGRRD